MRFGLSLACLASAVLANLPGHGYHVSYGNALLKMQENMPE